jgi:hypothetical protein
VLHVKEPDVLTAGGLLEILIRVTGMHGDISERFLLARDGSAFLHAEEYANIAIQIELEKMVNLADFFRALSQVDVNGDLDHFAQLMAHAAISVSQDGPTVADRRHRSEQVDPLTRKVRMEFSIACVVSFTQSCGYSVNIDDLLRDQISRALLVRDWAQLVRIFRKSLREALIAQLESKLAEESLVPEPVRVNAVPQLSAESYWNLRSVAMQERWSATDVLMLIEAYLSPSLDPHFAYRGIAVTGSEWRRLHDWMHRGRALYYDESSTNRSRNSNCRPRRPAGSSYRFVSGCPRCSGERDSHDELSGRLH